jgi:hypothetical protein
VGMHTTLHSSVGKRIGFLRVNKPVVVLNRGFECAAWWQHEVSAVGVFEVFLREQPYNKGQLQAVIKLPASVTDCYFGALFCGNPIGAYTEERKRQDCASRTAQIIVALPIAEAIMKSGNSQNHDGIDWAIDFSLWDPALEYCAAMMTDAKSWADHNWLKMQSDDEFHSALGAVEWASRNVAAWGKYSLDLHRQMKNHTGSFAELHAKNTAFANPQPPTEARHTPSPWYINAGSKNGRRDHQVYSDKDNRTIVAQIIHRDGLSADEVDANARFIVTACNSHASLVSACELADNFIRRMAVSGRLNPTTETMARQIADTLRTAIASARKGEA